MADTKQPTEPTKPVHTIVLDAGPLIKNIPPVSTLLAQSHELLTTPAVISEIRDPEARNRIQTLYLPFVTQRTPKPSSLSFVANFARKTGDRVVLSRTDLEVLALAYEVECERNGGDWRLKNEPGQKGINGMPPAKVQENREKDEEVTEESETLPLEKAQPEEDTVGEVTAELEATALNTDAPSISAEVGKKRPTVEFSIPDDQDDNAEEAEDEEEIDESDSDADGWITPSNIKKRQAKDAALAAGASPEPKTMQVATITTDFAMQNVLLQMNLNLLSTNTLQRISQLRSYIMRCHGCFATTRDMTKQFCPRCGQPTLTRVACSTTANGGFKLHLKKNMQWNTRGNRYSLPKPAHGSASGKWKGQGGGQSGWGTELILAEDQKEYVRAVTNESRRSRKERDLMDQDFLPGILTGERMKGGGRVKVGAGRTVNSKRRR
jgi:RNA-binding protein NOB1